MGELPEQKEANLKVLEQLQFHYQRIGENIRAAHDRKLIIQKQLADTELLLSSAESKKEEPSPIILPAPAVQNRPNKSDKKDPQEIQLEQLKSHLADLQTKYTEKHPDILVAKRRIAELEAKMEKEKSEKKIEEEVTVSTLPPLKMETTKEKRDEKASPKLNPRYKEMESQLIATELEIERLKEEESKVKAQINKYRERIENTPIRELAMAQLTRDYQNTKEIYQTLLKKSEEAQQAENLERRQKGEQFKVIDPARIPEKPFRPDIPKILIFGLLIGMASGFGMAFFKEQMDRSFRDAEDLEATLGFKVLANIPKIEEKKAA
jgi:capsular polysaccharide biosynthesis protein